MMEEALFRDLVWMENGIGFAQLIAVTLLP